MTTAPLPTADYHPQPVPRPPMFRTPLRLRACLGWLWHELVFPYGILYVGGAALVWNFLMPEWTTMATPSPGWILLIWARNAALLTMIAGGLHWWLYMRRSQRHAYKFNRRWLADGHRAFLMHDQVKDNMFWSLASGSVIWSLYEAATLWWYANGHVAFPPFGAAPGYFFAGAAAIFFWGTFHFYWIHRLLHWKPLYRIAHLLHHRNVNTGPWSGISMHPIEHALFFSVFLLWWVVPMHPVIIIAGGFYMALTPAISHCGFERVRVGGVTVRAGDYFHHLHHRYLEVNYGNTTTPLDLLFGTWHDGSEQAHTQFKQRRRAARG